MIFPPFTPVQIERLRFSYFVLIPNSIEFAEKFYARLFADHPEARGLFGEDMKAQHQKLMDMFTVLIESLDQEHLVVNNLEALRHRHVKYGALPEHYDWVEDSLLATLKDYLPHWESDDLVDLWKQLLSRISEVMKA
ncbi:MAG: hypothetical protein KF824_01805 [Fimbriimonadaceae bacterium]|nr:MAG: hypothetical protein KF824_01805 [Fimbriimonadaceae bacterium]